MQNVSWGDLGWIFGSLIVFVATVKWWRSVARLVRYARKYGLLQVHFMSSDEPEEDEIDALEKEIISPAVSAPQSEISAFSDGHFVGEIEDEINRRMADALARLVISGELQKTSAIKIGLGGKSGESYQAKKRLLDEALLRQAPPKFRADPEIDDWRRRLGLPIRR
jgi:hypothetical protein